MGKAQSDIMGLVVIVLIFIVAISFLLFFTLKGSDSRQLQSLDENLHTFNTITALLQTSTNCNGMSLSKVIEQCISTDNWKGEGCTAAKVGNVILSPCELSKGIVDFILKESFGEQNIAYSFYAYTDQRLEAIPPKMRVQEGECLGDVVSATQPLTFKGGKFFITLEVCEGEV
jgi:hypothetical protein